MNTIYNIPSLPQLRNPSFPSSFKFLSLVRSCEYDVTQKECRLSREDRRTKPSDFVSSPGSFIDYMENQCVMRE